MDQIHRSVSAADEVAELLRGEIGSGRLAPGTPLRQDDLATRYGTSRIPVREALRALQAEGLIDYAINRGAVVATVSSEDVLEMLEVRIALETHALRLAIPRMIEDEIEAAHEILRLYDEAPEPEQWAEMNTRFHNALYMPCENKRMMDAIAENYFHFNRFARTSLSTLTGKEDPQADHYKLLELCRKGEIEPAVKLLKHHIEKTQKLLRGQMRKLAGQR